MPTSKILAKPKKLASYLVSTYRRSELLRSTLLCMQETLVPESWELEICVAVPDFDEISMEIVRGISGAPNPITMTVTRDHDLTSQQRANLANARGELVMCSGDDDLHSPCRLVAAVNAYENGWVMSGAECFISVNQRTRRAAMWKGHPRHAGAFMNYRRDLIDEVFKRRTSGNVGKDGETWAAIEEMGFSVDSVKLLPDYLGSESVCIETVPAISKPKPYPDEGSIIDHGNFRVEGLGMWNTIKSLPFEVHRQVERQVTL